MNPIFNAKTPRSRDAEKDRETEIAPSFPPSSSLPTFQPSISLLVLALVTMLVWLLVSRQFGVSSDLPTGIGPYTRKALFQLPERSTFYSYRLFSLFLAGRERR